MNRTVRTTTRLLAGIAVPSITAAPVHSQDVIPERPSCATCRIVVRDVVTLGEADGPGALMEFPTDVGQDRAGRYWVLQWSEPPLVFSADGAHLATIGRRGAGPGEFRGLSSMTLLPGDTVALTDNGNQRMTLVDAALNPVREVVLPGQILAAVAVHWPDAVIVNALMDAPERSGRPLHLMDFSGRTAELSESLGEDESAIGRGDPWGLRTPIAPADGATVWSAGPGQYRFEQWRGGHRIARLRGQREWFPDGSFVHSGSPDRPPLSHVADLATDSAGILWVFTHVASDSWREAWPDLPPGTTGVSVRAMDGLRLYDTIVEVIDPATRTLLATARVERVQVIAALDNGRVALHAADDVGVPQVRIVEVELVR